MAEPAANPSHDDVMILLTDTPCDALLLTVVKAAAAAQGSLRFFLSLGTAPSSEPTAAYFGLNDPATGSMLVPPRRIGEDGVIAFDLPETGTFVLRLDFPKETRIETFGRVIEGDAKETPVSFGEGLLLYRTGKRVEFNTAAFLRPTKVRRPTS